jgi:hypothetical protein
MRELMPENAEGKWNPRREASCMLLADKGLDYPGQPFPDRCEGWKCKDRARLESRESGVRSLRLSESSPSLDRSGVRRG